MAASSNLIETPGLRIHYLQEGTGEPVLFLHGFPQTSHQWRHQMAALAAEGFACFAPDNRGFGRTEKPLTRIDRALLARDVVRFLDSLGLESVNVVGHDWGGIIAFKLVADHPERVRTLAVLDTLLTVWAPQAVHGYWFKAPGLAEAFFAEHHQRFIECLFGGRDYGDLPAAPASPWGSAAGAKPGPRAGGRPAWVASNDLDHYVDAFRDPATHHAAIQYYRYGLPFHVVDDGVRSLSETEVADMWLHPDGLEAHPLHRHFMDFAPEDRPTRFERPALWLYARRSRRDSGSGTTQGDSRIPAGNPFLDQFARNLTDLEARAVDSGHFLGEEQPEFVSETLARHLRRSPGPS